MGLGSRRGHSEECRLRMEVCLSENVDDRHRMESQKSKLDTYTAAEGEKTMKETLGEREDPLRTDEPNNEMNTGEDLECAPGSSKDIRVEAFDDAPPQDDLQDAPGGKSDRRVRTPIRKKAIKRANTGVHDEEPALKNVIIDDGKDDVAIAEPEHFVISSPVGSDDDSMRRTGFDSLSTIDRYIAAKAILGADLSECISESARLDAAKKCSELMSTDIMEVYSPERVAKLCGEFGLTPGSSLDLTNGFDFDTALDRERAWMIVRRDQPLLIIGSPPCTYFSALNELNKYIYRNDAAWMQRFDDNLNKAKRHVRFCCLIY